jgi:hypothetical protein
MRQHRQIVGPSRTPRHPRVQSSRETLRHFERPPSPNHGGCSAWLSPSARHPTARWRPNIVRIWNAINPRKPDVVGDRADEQRVAVGHSHDCEPPCPFKARIGKRDRLPGQGRSGASHRARRQRRLRPHPGRAESPHSAIPRRRKFRANPEVCFSNRRKTLRAAIGHCYEYGEQGHTPDQLVIDS